MCPGSWDYRIWVLKPPSQGLRPKYFITYVFPVRCYHSESQFTFVVDDKRGKQGLKCLRGTVVKISLDLSRYLQNSNWFSLVFFHQLLLYTLVPTRFSVLSLCMFFLVPENHNIFFFFNFCHIPSSVNSRSASHFDSVVKQIWVLVSLRQWLGDNHS